MGDPEAVNMDRREQIQLFLTKGREELSKCHTMTRKLDGLKGILFMRRDVACEAVKLHIAKLTSRLNNIGDLRLEEIEHFCHDKETSLNNDKKTVLEKLSVLTETCSKANEFLQFGKEYLCSSPEYDSLISTFHQLLQPTEGIQVGEEECSLSYEPILPESFLQMHHIGILKTSSLDSRKVEIAEDRNQTWQFVSLKDATVVITVLTNVRILHTEDLKLFQVSVTDDHDIQIPVEITPDTKNSKHVFVSVAVESEGKHQLIVKLNGMHVVNSPYEFSVKVSKQQDGSNNNLCSEQVLREDNSSRTHGESESADSSYESNTSTKDSSDTLDQHVYMQNDERVNVASNKTHRSIRMSAIKEGFHQDKLKSPKSLNPEYKETNAGLTSNINPGKSERVISPPLKVNSSMYSDKIQTGTQYTKTNNGNTLPPDNQGRTKPPKLTSGRSDYSSNMLGYTGQYFNSSQQCYYPYTGPIVGYSFRANPHVQYFLQPPPYNTSTNFSYSSYLSGYNNSQSYHGNKPKTPQGAEVQLKLRFPHGLSKKKTS